MLLLRSTLCLLLLAGCGEVSDGLDAAAGGDATSPLDSGRPESDASTGASLDAGSDASSDAGPFFSATCSGPAPEGYEYEAAQSYYGRNGYIEYVPGELPIIISAPHGGYLEPDEIPPQDGVLRRDGGSQETAWLLRDFLLERTGKAPHLIVNHLTRHRLNANRDREGASYGNEYAARAWDEFHEYTEAAKAWVTSACGRGHYFDLHTNGHSDGWVEIGLALDRADLNLPDDELDTLEMREKSTLRSLASLPGISFIEIVRGPTSLGGLLDRAGVHVVPSPTHPGPGTGGYFNGGYNVRRHGSRDGGVIDGTQIETHFQYINQGAAKREAYAEILADAIIEFMETHYGFDL